MKKILFVTPYFPPHTGGTQHYVENIAAGLHGRYRWNAVVVTSNTQDNTYRRTREKGITVYRLPILFTVSNTPIHPRWYFLMKKIITAEKPDVINAHAPVPYMADIAAMAAGNIPFVLTYHTGPMMKKGEIVKDALLSVYERVILPRMAHRANAIICASDYVKRTVLSRYAGKTTTVSPGVDTDIFTPASRASNKRLLFVGSLHKAERYKGLYTLLQSVRVLRKKIRGLTLTVLGDGDFLHEYQEMCKELDIEKQVVFAGNVRGKALIAAYHAATLVVHPSRFDSYPLVLLEAMACKIPIVSTIVGGIPEIVTHKKTGLLVPPENPEALAAAIKTLLSDDKLAQRLSMAGYEHIRKVCTWDAKTMETNKLLQTIIH